MSGDCQVTFEQYYECSMLFSLICIMLVLQPMVVPHAPLHHANISASSTQVVSEVLSKMLMVGITDPGML